MSRTPTVAHTRAELADLLARARSAGEQVGFVPTMGALHDGHASLMRVARERVGDGPVVVSVFVNPLQFGAGEDLDRYPRTLDADLEVCAREGVDIVFAPAAEEVYPGWPERAEPQVTIEPGPLATVLEGRTRPGHFRGMLIVVAKLLGLVRPDVAVFGQKDYQQLVLVQQMVADLCLGVEIVGAATCREPDGLALSSRAAQGQGGRSRLSRDHRPAARRPARRRTARDPGADPRRRPARLHPPDRQPAAGPRDRRGLLMLAKPARRTASEASLARRNRRNRQSGERSERLALPHERSE